MGHHLSVMNFKQVDGKGLSFKIHLAFYFNFNHKRTREKEEETRYITDIFENGSNQQ